MSQSSGGRARNGVGQSGGAAFGNHHRGRAGRVSGADDGAEIVRVLNAVEHHMQPALGGGFFQRGVAGRGSVSDDALMRRPGGVAVEMLARLKADRNSAPAAQLNQFLKAHAGRPACDNHHRSSGNPARIASRTGWIPASRDIRIRVLS